VTINATAARTHEPRGTLTAFYTVRGRAPQSGSRTIDFTLGFDHFTATGVEADPGTRIGIRVFCQTGTCSPVSGAEKFVTQWQAQPEEIEHVAVGRGNGPDFIIGGNRVTNGGRFNVRATK
jgi:hypothetical protein